MKKWIENIRVVFETASKLQAEASTVYIRNSYEEKRRAAKHRWFAIKDRFEKTLGWIPTKWSWAHYDFWVGRNPYMRWSKAPGKLHQVARIA